MMFRILSNQVERAKCSRNKQKKKQLIEREISKKILFVVDKSFVNFVVTALFIVSFEYYEENKKKKLLCCLLFYFIFYLFFNFLFVVIVCC
jgi:lipopolysaccharide export LptBFGC system permease protein LptF